ncbi:MAG: peptide-methionine (S)-S-oxide reductase [Bacteroidetes bacterium HGW-Bacteroidetes-21]|nr:MAG: peptide-methionine (S)-S-oxide reductase [Bacteroidetes bacterium HGW-Bacteroidetes-21]
MKTNDKIQDGKNPLTDFEQKVLLYKYTERPHSGEYETKNQEGTYLCKYCNEPLYKSLSKFDAQCGWPSFDDEIPGSEKRTLDDDGRRTEITCASCGGHLGHVFEGEGYTDKNVRHCVNSVSLRFIPAVIEKKPERAVFAGGCFWGVEYYFSNLPGIYKVTSGYMGGAVENPTYEMVCEGNTGHAEVVEVFFNPDSVTYEKLLKIFFEIHDFSQINRQGPDVGVQYRSEIFYFSEKQKEIAEKLVNQLKEMSYTVATKITPAGVFWEAESYHQKYYERKGGRPYCHVHRKVF